MTGSRFRAVFGVTVMTMVAAAACTVPDFAFPPRPTDASATGTDAATTSDANAQGQGDGDVVIDTGIDSPIGRDPRCPEGVVARADGVDHCYFYLVGQYGDCGAGCPAAAHAVTITSEAENINIQESVLPVGTHSSAQVPGDFWLNLRAIGDASLASSFDWRTHETGTFTLWGVDRPNGSGPCVIDRFDQPGHEAGWWDDRPVDQTHHLLCERDLP